MADWTCPGCYSHQIDQHAMDCPYVSARSLATLQAVGVPVGRTDVGVKNDIGKQRYDLLAPEALGGLVAVLTFGASKYDARNWEKGIKYGRVFGAAMRHLWAWWCGQDTDDETGLSHLDHAACCIHFLSTYTKRKMTEFDDRPKQ